MTCSHASFWVEERIKAAFFAGEILLLKNFYPMRLFQYGFLLHTESGTILSQQYLMVGSICPNSIKWWDQFVPTVITA